MKLKYKHIRLAELFLTFLMVLISLYSFSKNRFYELITSSLQQLFAFLHLEVSQLTSVILLTVIILFFYFYAKGQEKHMDMIYAISWLMHLPSILSYSKLDWPKLLGSPINFQLFETKLSFTDTLIISAILVSGRIFLLFTSQIRETLKRLQKRGADENDLITATSGMIVVALSIITLSSVAALSMSYFIPVIEALLMPVIVSIPYPYLAIGVACLIAIPIITIGYLYSKAQI